MLSQDNAVSRPPAAPTELPDLAESFLPLELMELELSLENYEDRVVNFPDTVRQAAEQCGGAFLFDLPGTGLIEDCSRIAIIRMREREADIPVTLVILSANGKDIRVERPTAETEHLVRLASAFVDVLTRI